MSYTRAHTNITPSLPHSHTYLCSARFVANITHQRDNDREKRHWLLCMLFSGTSGNYVRATWNRVRSRGLATPDIVYHTFMSRFLMDPSRIGVGAGNWLGLRRNNKRKVHTEPYEEDVSIQLRLNCVASAQNTTNTSW